MCSSLHTEVFYVVGHTFSHASSFSKCAFWNLKYLKKYSMTIVS